MGILSRQEFTYFALTNVRMITTQQRKQSPMVSCEITQHLHHCPTCGDISECQCEDSKYQKVCSTCKDWHGETE